MDTTDGHEMLRLLLQPPRNLCASTGHYPHLPSWEPVQPTSARVPRSRVNFPRRTHGMPQAVAMSHWPLPPQACPTFHIPPSPPAWVSQSPLISCYFNPILSEQRTDALRWPTGRGGAKYKPEAQELCKTKKRKGNLSQQPQEQQIKSPQSNWCAIHLWVTWIDNESSQIEVVDFGSNCTLGVCFLHPICFWFYVYLSLVFRVYYHW